MEKIIHFLVPRQSNNQKAKVLHTSSLIVLSFFLIVFQLLLNNLSKVEGVVLGFASNISVKEVVRLTNLKRAEAGLPALTLNQTLSNAAYAKGVDMINKDYWAHTAPDGTEPWAFFNSLGYKYRYAGENLARDFSNPGSAVDAWMASPSHKDNILNPKYKEIGVGVVEGDLAGSDTTIVVQFFGTSYTDSVKPTLAVTDIDQNKIEIDIKGKSEEVIEEKVNIIKDSSEIATLNEKVQEDLVLSSSENKVLVSPFVTTKNTSLIAVSVLAIVFLVDWLIVSKRRIIRVAGKSLAHISYLGMIFAVALILKAGKII